MRIFLAGIMQGSQVALALHDQDYRAEIKALLAAHLPEAEVHDPLAGHRNSLSYDDDFGRRVFLHHNALCAQVDVLLAFVPQASMGTAIEMWEAHRHGRVVLTVSPLAHNWAVKFLSHRVYPDLDQLAAELASGAVRRLLEDLRAGPPGGP